MDDCIFCKICRNEIPADKVAETEDVVAFRDIRPQAPVHVLVIPKKHIQSAYHVTGEDEALIGKIHVVAAQVAKSLDISDSGYRLVTNIGHHGQQTVLHLHYHLLGGRQLGWPPG